jgi:tetratricopeptide (TPR) repeat protein
MKNSFLFISVLAVSLSASQAMARGHGGRAAAASANYANANSGNSSSGGQATGNGAGGNHGSGPGAGSSGKEQAGEDTSGQGWESGEGGDAAEEDKAGQDMGEYQDPQKEQEDEAPVKARPRPVYAKCVSLALKYISQKKYGSASDEFNKALAALSEEDPRKIYVYERLGWLALMQNDVDSAEGFYAAGTYQAENMETYDKNAVSAYRGEAFCNEKQGNILSAIGNYGKALKYTTDKAARAKLQKKIRSLKARRN